jgi:small-conductance mechanosensitive channel
LSDKLTSGMPAFGSEDYQKMKDNRDALCQKQQDLASKEFQADDSTFQQASTDLQKATQELNDEIKSTQNIDKIFGIISEISASADELIKIA